MTVTVASSGVAGCTPATPSISNNCTPVIYETERLKAAHPDIPKPSAVLPQVAQWVAIMVAITL